MAIGFVLAIPQCAVAPIIGPKGEKVRDIIEASGCEKIDVPKTSSFGSDYAIRVIGTEPATIDATRRIYAVVQDIANRSRLSERDFVVKPPTSQKNTNSIGPDGAKTKKSDAAGMGMISNAVQVTDPIKFVLNKPEASWTIGKGGNVIRELR